MQTLSRITKQTLALVLTAGACLLGASQGYSQPTTSASVPTEPQGHVVSLWNSSGTYTNVAVGDYFELWYAADPYFYPMPDTGSNVLLYADMSCCAAITTGTNPAVDASGCTNLHLDVFTPDGNNFKIRLVDSLSHSADVLFDAAGGVITNGGWISLNIPLSQFTAANSSLNLWGIKQIGWIDSEGGGTVPANYYIDNVYFNAGTNLVFTPPPVIASPTNNAPTPTNSPALSLYNSSGTYTDVTASEWPTFWSGSACTDFAITNPPGSTVKYLPGLSYVGVQYPANSVDTTGYNTLHFDVWTLDGNQFAIQLVSLNPTAAAQVMSSIGVTQQWVSVDIPLSQFAAANPATILTDVEQVLFVDNVGPGIQGATFYIDNVYFYSNSITPPVVVNYPTNNAPTPTKAADSVLSMYNSSGTYADHGGIVWYASWSGVSSMGDFTITNTGAVVKKYLGLSYSGVEFYNPNQIDASSYNTLHLDVWTTANQLAIKLVSTGNGAAPEYIIPASSGTIASNQWVGLDIPLSEFTALVSTLDLANLDQMLFVDNGDISGSGVQFGNFYVDNVYFYSAVVTQPVIQAPTLSGGNIGLPVSSVSGVDYVLETTPTLSPASWTAIQTNAGTGGTLNFSVPAGTGNGFFRIKAQ